MKVLGVKDVNFKDEKGKSIQGVNVFVAYPEDGVDGLMTEKIFLSLEKFDTVCENIKPGMELEVVYNRFGKVSKAQIV